MIDGATNQNEADAADGAHNDRAFGAEGMHNKKVQQYGDGKVETYLTDQTQHCVIDQVHDLAFVGKQHHKEYDK